MGGEGSGRKPDPIKQLIGFNQPANTGVSPAFFLPNLSGTKHEIKEGTSNITTDDLAEGTINKYYDATVAANTFLKLDQTSAQTITASPVLNWLTASQALMTDANKKLISVDYLNQAVKTTSNVTFNSVTSTLGVSHGAFHIPTTGSALTYTSGITLRDNNSASIYSGYNAQISLAAGVTYTYDSLGLKFPAANQGFIGKYNAKILVFDDIVGGTTYNYWKLTNSGTGVNPVLTILAQSDTNVGLELKSIGTGSIVLNANNVNIGKGTAGVDYTLTFDGETNDGVITWMEDEDYFKFSDYLRHTSANYRRYYHLPISTFDPGASGATWTAPSTNIVGGYQLNAATEFLYFDSDIHNDWDAVSDLKVEIYFAVNVDNTGGADADTVDLKLVCYYNAVGDTATKTQTQEVATIVGKSAQYKVFKATFTINYDEVSNVVEAGDLMGFALNLETDTSEVDDIIVLHGALYYNTTHIGIESGDA